MTSRDAAKLVYRALRDAGPRGLNRLELQAATGLNSREVLATVTWLRSSSVQVRFCRSDVPGEWSRFTLAERLPASWDELV